MGQSKCSHIINFYWIFLGNSRVQVAVPRGPKQLPSAPLTLYVHCVINGGLGSSLSKHAFDMQEIVAPVLNNDTV